MSRKDWTSNKIFTRLLENKTRKTYWHTIHELRQRPNQEVFNRAYQLAKSEKDKEKIIGIDILAQLGFNPRFNKKEAVDLYFELLDHQQSPKVLKNILSAIGHNNNNNGELDDTRISKLTEFQNHPFSDVRFSLVLALSGIEHDMAIETLIKLSRDKHPGIRDWATFSIGSQIVTNNEKIIKVLWDRTNDEDEATRFEAISGLAKRKDPKIEELLIKELKNIDNHGCLILESIEALNDKDFIPLLENQIEINKKTKQVHEKWLLDCMEKLKENTQ